MIPTAKVGKKKEKRGRHPSIPILQQGNIHTPVSISSLALRPSPPIPLQRLSHSDPHLDIMALVPIILVTSPIVRVGRGAIGKVVQIQLPMHRRLDVTTRVLCWWWRRRRRVPAAAAKVAAGRRRVVQQQGGAERQGRVVFFKLVGVGFGVGEGLLKLVIVEVRGFRVGFLLAVEGEASG